MPLLSQNRFPALWRLFQYWIGGTVDKRRLCLQYYGGQGRVLEVGCSLGNIAKAFTRFHDVDYTGIDIDPVVIDYARRDFNRWKNFRFLSTDLREFAASAKPFDYILFAGILHHVDDQLAHELLQAASSLLAGTGKLVIVDPLLVRKEDSWLLHQYVKLEQGEYLRSGGNMLGLLQGVPGLQLTRSEERLIGASPLRRPICARFGLYTLSTTSGERQPAG